jgi:hypothetical protein
MASGTILLRQLKKARHGPNFARVTPKSYLGALSALCG